MVRGALVRQGMLDERWTILRGPFVSSDDDTVPNDSFIPTEPDSGHSKDVRYMNKIKLICMATGTTNQEPILRLYGLHKDGQGDFIGEMTWELDTTIFGKSDFTDHNREVQGLMEGESWKSCDLVAIVNGLYGSSVLTKHELTVGSDAHPCCVVVDLTIGGWETLEAHLNVGTATKAVIMMIPIA